MKSMITITSALAAILLLAVTASFGQTAGATVTISEKNAPLDKVIREIGKQSGYAFMYGDDMLKGSTPVTVELKNVPVDKALEVVFKDQPVTYTIVDKTIVLKRNENYAKKNDDPAPRVNTIKVTGTVKDKDGNGLAGANIVVKGTTTGVSTDANGSFSITVNDDDRLVVTFIGYKNREVTIDARTQLEVVLEEDQTTLGEVTVNAGYYSVTQEKATGSISRVDSKIIERQPVSNVLQTLQGRMPGVTINQSSGLPGSNFQVRIRGTNSLSSGNDPLYIIDGIPFISESISSRIAKDGIFGSGGGLSPLNSFNPNDIESIEVLKDADATAIYGSRGANGVILITTKKGKSGVTKLNLDFKSGASKVTRFMDMLNTEQYIAMRMKAVENDAAYNSMSPVPGSKEYDINGTWSQTRYTDWQKVLLGGTARMSDLNASLSGGSGNTRFLFSTGYNGQTTVFPGDAKATRFTSHFSVTHLSKDQKLDVKFSTSYIITKSDLANRDFTEFALRMAPNAPALYDAAGKLNWESGTWQNPLGILENRFLARTHNLLTGVDIGYKILPNLTVKANVGLNDTRNDEKDTDSSDSRNPFMLPVPTPASSRMEMGYGVSRSMIIEPQANSQATLGKGRLDVLVGGTYQARVGESTHEKFTGFASNALIQNPNAATTIELNGYGYYEYKYAALFGRINYNWDGKYILNLTGRRDGSSRFGPGRRFANFGAAGFAWIFSNEKFIKEHVPVISFGKLRTSYGITGNDQIGDYQYLNSYSSSTQYGNLSVLDATQLFNPDFSWEVNRKLEAALETGFFNDRILFTAAFYRNRSSNQLVQYQLAGTSGFATILKNFPATVQNTGVELELTTVNLDNAWRWATSWNITFPRNELVEFPGLESSSYASKYVVGQPLSIAKRYHFLGVNPETGKYEFEDTNGDGYITSSDQQKWLIYKQPRIFGGVTNSISFKGFQVDIFIQLVSKYDQQFSYFGPLGSFSYEGFVSGNQPESTIINSWSGPGDHAQYQYPSRSTSMYNNQQLYERSDGYGWGSAVIRYARLKNVSISYQIPDNWTRRFTARMYLQGQNLFTVTNYRGLDPETGSNALPPLTTLVAGIQFGI